LNIANAGAGLQKIVEIEDDKMLLPFFDKRMGAEVPGDSLGEEFKGYVFKISGGNDKQGFPMMQGVLCNNRVRLLFKKGMKTYRPRRQGSFKRKSVRGCVVGPDLAVLDLVLVSKGPTDIPGLTDDQKPRRLGPKRASKIRKLFGLTKEDDVRKYAVRRDVTTKAGKTKSKAPRIQRLITATRLQRKRHLRNSAKKHFEGQKAAAAQYAKTVEEWKISIKEKRATELAKKKKEVAKKQAAKAK